MARELARHGSDLVVVAEDRGIHDAADSLRRAHDTCTELLLCELRADGGR